MSRLITIINAVNIFLLIASAIGFGLIISKLDPSSSNFHLVLFYVDFAVLAFSLVFIAGFYARRWFGFRELSGQYQKISARQALWLTILAVASLILLSFGLFNLWNVLLMVLCLIFLEFYFLSK